jgi:hypothetical protein
MLATILVAGILSAMAGRSDAAPLSASMSLQDAMPQQNVETVQWRGRGRLGRARLGWWLWRYRTGPCSGSDCRWRAGRSLLRLLRRRLRSHHIMVMAAMLRAITDMRAATGAASTSCAVLTGAAGKMAPAIDDC